MKKEYSIIFPKYMILQKIRDKQLLKIVDKDKTEIYYFKFRWRSSKNTWILLKKNLNMKTKIICAGAAISFFTKDQVPINKFLDMFFLGWLTHIIFKPNIYFSRYAKAFQLFKLYIVII